MSGEVVSRSFAYDGGRQVTAYLPSRAADALVYVADGGWHLPRLIAELETQPTSTPALVGIDGLTEDEDRLAEYSCGFDPARFAAHEHFVVHEVGAWARDELGIAVPAARTAVWGASAGAELALALGVRHPDLYGVVFCLSPGGGYGPPETLPAPLPRAYLVGGRDEPWFLGNAQRWAQALSRAGADVVVHARPGAHGDAFWFEELPGMLAWAFPT